MFDLQHLPVGARALAEHRTFPIQIFSLGRFSVSRGAEPIRFARKAQHRPLELLKVLLALGGREVATDQLAAALWPESEGDVAYNAFEITLHRLRRLLGIEKSLVLSNGLLTLDNRLCWVDIWALEQATGNAESLLNKGEPDPDALASLSSTVLALYHGHFLGRETPEAWSISLRERLRSKFLRHLIDVARFWERIGRHESAIECYLKGLEVDDLAEIFYQRLMVCYQQLGRRSEALAVYRRCRTTLSLILAISPSPATDAIHRRLIQV
ncbi:MAG: bacterial transcriptional activator domain-containing protein [Gammaproteobacteria bacterium]|nr:bacterial transcriptional activator domain-containing protein [Gammaproteobacteria bacterium]MDH5512392.1 bacterial transcriptional activator domain-containing protein [Gammaproteobacteria bacterium]